MSDEILEEGAEKISADELELRKRIAFGFDVENFLTTPIGKYLAQRAENERVALLEQLTTIDHNKADHIHRIQTRIAILDHWQEGLADAVTDGYSAQQQLIEQLG